MLQQIDTLTDKHSGVVAATIAYLLWGTLPVYWKLLLEVPAYEILCHRMVWSLLVTGGLVLVLGKQRSLWASLKDLKTVAIFTLVALLLGVNWLVYIWSVNAGYIIEASLGYFINPLINVLLGVIFFKERMRPMQWFALLLVCCGVVYLTLYYGQFPWIALTLALTFSVYGLLHKKISVPPLEGLCLETIVLFVPALFFLVLVEVKGNGAFYHGGQSTSLLLAGTGAVTAIPLLFFGYAAKKMSLSTLGLLQYMAPTISLLIGIFMYGESFPQERVIGFSIIWAALLLYISDNMVNRARQKKKLQ